MYKTPSLAQRMKLTDINFVESSKVAFFNMPFHKSRRTMFLRVYIICMRMCVYLREYTHVWYMQTNRFFFSISLSLFFFFFIYIKICAMKEPSISSTGIDTRSGWL